MKTELAKHVKEELSGSSAKSFVAKICEFHRVQASPMYHEAAELLKDELIKMGLDDADIEQFPADGRHRYWSHISPVGWVVKSAELRLLEPVEALVVRFEDVPQSLHSYSNGTPPEGVTAELVDVGPGSSPRDYEGKDVKGKLVLTTGRGDWVHEMAVVKRGAAGVITDSVIEMHGIRESADIPDAHGYYGVWPTGRILDKVTFGFSVTKRQGNHLRSMLRDGKTVRLRAKVDARLFSGKIDVLTATIQGSSRPEEEIFLVAHLCHPKPGANDNASGSGCLMEIARTIRTLVDSNKIKAPARTVRFLWVPETEGSVAWLAANNDAPSKLVAGINLDMVGENQELCGSTLVMDRTPDSLPSYLNDLVLAYLEQTVDELDWRTSHGSAPTFRFSTSPFSGGSDHVEFVDSTVGIPCSSLTQWPDKYYHTSMDTLDKVDERSLKRAGWVTAMTVLTLADADHDLAYQLANLTISRGMERIMTAARQAADELFKIRDDPGDDHGGHGLVMDLARALDFHKARIDHLVLREQEASRSVKRLGSSPELNSFLNAQRQELAARGRQEKERLESISDFISKSLRLRMPTELEEKDAERELKTLVPRRAQKGSLSNDYLKEHLTEADYAWHREVDDKDPGFTKKTMELLNFMDGKRTAFEIMIAVSSEYNSRMNPDNVLRFLRDMERAEFIQMS